MPGRIDIQIDSATAVLRFDHPERRNAMTLAMWEAIPGLVARLDGDPAIRAIVLRGDGDRAFVSGSDVSEFGALRDGDAAIQRYGDIADAALTALRRVRKPMLAAIQGHCVGGGISIALCCDLRIATASARFAMPAARIGLAYRLADLKPIVDAVGIDQAKLMFFTARGFDAAEAHRIGLVTTLVPDEALQATVDDLCLRIADNAPLTLRATKAICGEIARPDGAIDATLCERAVLECFASEDYVEGRRAFGEKRKPVFRGK